MAPVLLAMAATTLAGLLGHSVGFRRGYRAGRIDQIRTAILGNLGRAYQAATVARRSIQEAAMARARES